MRSLTLQALTWGTVTAAVSSALWLAAGESSRGDSRMANTVGSTLVLPQEPTSAGRPAPAAIVERAQTAGTLPLPTGR
jgi:hypothetical protein